jgi:hypothetical protein
MLLNKFTSSSFPSTTQFSLGVKQILTSIPSYKVGLIDF